MRTGGDKASPLHGSMAKGPRRYNGSAMSRFLKRLLLMLATLGAGALAYTLMRAEGERALRRVRRGAEPLPPLEPSQSPRKPAAEPESARAEAAPAAEPAEPVRCVALKADGARCSRDAQPGSEYCWQHA